MSNSESNKRPLGWIKTAQKRKRKMEYEKVSAPGVESIKDSESTREARSQREGEERFRSFLDNLGDVAYETDTSGNVTYANKMAEKITGIPLKDIIGKPFLLLFTNESRQIAVNVHEKILNGEGTEYELTFTNGRICHFKNEPLRDNNGKVIGVFGIARDVTKCKQVEKALRESEERFRMMLENLPNVAVQGYAPDGTVQYWNKANESIYGYTAKEAIGKDLVELIIAPEMRDSVREAIAHGARTGEMPLAAELNLMRKDGSYVPVWSSHAVVRHAGKEPELYCIDVDLSELKRTEKALRESEERFKNLFNNALLGLYRTTPDGQILMANPALIRMLGYDSFEELAKRNLEEEGFEPRYFRSSFKERVEGEGRVIGLEADWKRRDGTILSIRESARAIRDEHGNILYYEGTVEDITDRKRAEEELRRHRDHLEEIVAARTFELERSNAVLQAEIAERKQAEEALQDSEEKLRRAQEVAHIGSWYQYIKTNRLVWSDEVYRIFGVPVGKQLEEADFLALVHPDDEPYVRRSWAAALKGERYDIEHRIVTADTVKWVREKAELEFDADGKPVLGIGIVQDITERKQAEEALRESESRFRELVENMREVFWMENAAGTEMLYISPTYEQVWGRSCQSFYENPQDWIESIHPEDRQRIIEAFSQLRKTGEYSQEFRIVRSDGAIRWIWDRGVLIRNESDEIIHVAGVAEDITERRQAEEALRESEEKFRSLAEQSPNMIFINKRGKVIYVNKKCEEIMGYRREELCSDDFDFRILIAPESMGLVNDNFIRHSRGEEVNPYDYCLINKKGERIEAMNASKLIQYEGQTAVLGVVTDITERKRTEKELLEYQAKLKSLASQLSLTEERERHRLATHLHDQISQSLVISKIKLDRLRKSSTSDEVNMSLEDISNCLGQTIDDTRVLTFDLSYPILYELGFEAAVAEWLADQIQEKHGIRTEFVDDGHKKPLDDDIRVLLFRNVRELLINIVKHAQANKVRVSIRKVKDNICVSVEDDGVGFDTVKATSLATKKAEFGLFSIRERLEQLGGLIEIDSKIGHGSRITMTAPLKLNNSTDRA